LNSPFWGFAILQKIVYFFEEFKKNLFVPVSPQLQVERNVIPEESCLNPALCSAATRCMTGVVVHQ
jgi:hypothetical protein